MQMFKHILAELVLGGLGGDLQLLSGWAQHSPIPVCARRLPQGRARRGKSHLALCSPHNARLVPPITVPQNSLVFYVSVASHPPPTAHPNHPNHC
jgi:hypothetical protein